MQTLILLLTLITTNPSNYDIASCHAEFVKAYKLATEWVYPSNTYIGELLDKGEHNCNGWLPAEWSPGKVAVRPLYEDSGLPIYDVFEEEWEVLVGFEFISWTQIAKACKLVNKTKGFNTWCCWESERELWRGYSIALTEREKFLYAIMD